MWRLGWIVGVGLFTVCSGVALGQPIASPPPISSRTSSGVPLSETFTPSLVFPNNPTPTPRPAPLTESVLDPEAPVEPRDRADGGLLPMIRLPKPWTGGMDLGLNGASGNSDVFNFRGGWNVRRKTDTNVFTSDFLYVYAVQNRKTSTQQALLNSRDEILFPGSRWSLFTANQVEYDELRAYRFRVGIYGGTGYTVFDDSRKTLRTRIGVGAVRELGSDGSASRWVEEFLLGYDFRCKVSEHSSLISIMDLYPRIGDWGQFRLRARVAYEYVIDPETGTVLRVGVQDRYDSDPGNAKRNDLTYFTTLGLKF